MKSYKIYLLLGLLLSIAALAFYLFDENSEGGQFMAPKKWKTITVFEDYSLEMMSFMKERNREDISETEKIEYENLIREIFITIEKYQTEGVGDKSKLDDEQIFAEELLKMRKESAQALFSKRGQIPKELSASSSLSIPDMNAAWFSMKMGGKHGVPATYHVIALYEDRGQFYLLTTATQEAFREIYEAAFLKMIQSFKARKEI